jgi:outer membrane protein OmpA-like peptidoglycan-associated protein
MIQSIKKFIGLLGAAALFACAGTDIEAPVSSSELVDSNVEYAVEGPAEEALSPEREFVLEGAEDSGAITSNPSIPVEAEAMPVIMPEPAKEDSFVDFTPEAYMTDVEFDEAVRAAQARRGIDPARAAAPKPVSAAAKPGFKGRLNVAEAPKEEARPAEILFLSSVIYHSKGMADMSAKDMAAVREVARFAKSRDAKIRVVGHSSSRTRDMRELENKLVNLDLSIKRAGAVRDALASSGIKPADVMISGVSDTENVAYENMPINEAVNRRTEIYIEY